MAEKVQKEIQDGYDQYEITLAAHLDLWMKDYKTEMLVKIIYPH